MGEEGHDQTARSDAPPAGVGDLETIDAARELAVETPASIEPADRLGRYALLRRVGAGAMGFVHAAYDNSLDRRVAIKLIHEERSDSPGARERLLREAKALARLSHPNVAHVYEVGEDRGRLFIAMEFVPGGSLREWLDERPLPRDHTEVVRMFATIGAGLSAAHHANVIHRDFKPDNVLLTERGEPKVVDFGLAGLGVGRAEEDIEPADDSAEGPTEKDAQSLTQTGAVIGTPVYMSPEQINGDGGDPRSDQFSYCVSLYEALVGRRPFSGATIASLQSDIVRGKVRPIPADAGVPGWLASLVMRGLAVDPDDRFPDMDALVAALRHDRSRGRGVAWAVAALGVAGLATAALWPAAPASDACEGGQAELEQTWGDEQRAAIAKAFDATTLPYAKIARQRTIAALDEYGQQWVAMRKAACTATHVQRVQSTELLDLRMECLHAAKVRLDAVVEILETADRKVVGRAFSVVGGLPPIERCGDLEALRRDATQPQADELAAVEALRTATAHADALVSAGRYRAAVDELQPLVGQAEALSFEPTLAHVLARLGRAQARVGSFADAESSLRRSIELATRLDRWETVLRATADLAELLAEHERAGEALAFSDIASALAGRGEPSVDVERTRAFVLMDAGRPADAEAVFRRILERDSRDELYDAIDVAAARGNLGWALSEQGRYAEAEAEYRVALEATAEGLGPKHPQTANWQSGLALCAMRQGRLAEAEDGYRAHVEALTLSLGATNLRVAHAKENLGVVLRQRGKLAEAEVEQRSALAIEEIEFGKGSAPTSGVLNNLGLVLLDQERFEEAEAVFRAGIEAELSGKPVDEASMIRLRGNLGLLFVLAERFTEAEAEYEAVATLSRSVLGRDHPSTLLGDANMADLYTQQGRYAEAERAYQDVLSRGAELYDPGHPLLTLWTAAYGGVLFELGRPKEAVEALEVAWREREQQVDLPPNERAETARALATALWDTGEHPRARTIAQRARTLFEQAEGDHTEDIAGMNDWLAAHR
ncbi:MAG: tetratricopeptide repeat protein [Myxococcota bacterium]